MRIRTFRFLAGGATPSKTKFLLRFTGSVTEAAVGSSLDGSTDGFLGFLSTVLTYLWLSLC